LEFERDVLIGAGAEVTTAMSTDATREHLQSGKFDAVVLNGRMPGGANAIEMYRWIASQAFGMEKKLMMTFSTVADPETRRFLQENGVPILSKPFEVADLISQVRKLLHKTEAQKEGGSESEFKPAQPESSSDEKAAAAGSGS
jgi:DNA-binding NtrC family response regulator